MPIFFQREINTNTKIGTWRIEEGEDFFLQKVLPQRHVSHPHKKLQHLAGRYLLKNLFVDFPIELIQIADTRKPFLEDEAYHFSISHCGDFAAAIVSKKSRVGVDIELVTDKIARVQHKFVSEEEWEVVNREWSIVNGQWSMDYDGYYTSNPQSPIPDPQLLLTLMWSCKEAVFKWYGLGEVDFKQHISIQKIKQVSAAAYETEIRFQKDGFILLTLYSELFFSALQSTNNEQRTTNSLILSYVTT